MVPARQHLWPVAGWPARSVTTGVQLTVGQLREAVCCAPRVSCVFSLNAQTTGPAVRG